MFWIVQVVIVSFVIIFLLHHLYCFFKETLTVPKMKDMVKRPQQKYDTLFRELRMRNEAPNDNAENDVTHANTAMKNELKRYLKELNAPQSQPQPQPQSQQHPDPEPHPQFNSNFIEMGSAYQ
jgi:hypothetical protein